MDSRALLTDAGARLLGEVCTDSRDDLALASALRGKHPVELLSLALQQRELRRRGAARFLDAPSMLFTKAGLEQASSTLVARNRASKLEAGMTVADICCGIGGDSVELAKVADSVIGVDLDEEHLALAAHNVGPAFTPVHADAATLPPMDCDALLIDPARREGESRRRGHLEMSPALDVCLALADGGRRVTIKAAPGLDVAAVPEGWTIEAVATGRDLKEMTLWSPAWGLPQRIATVIRGDFHHSACRSWSDAQSPQERVRIAQAGSYLFDPSPTITRTGQVQGLAQELDAWMLDERIAFLSSDQPLEHYFARTLHVLDSLPWSLKAVKLQLRALNISDVEIRQRGLSTGNVDETRHKLSGKGDNKAVLVLTRLGTRPWAYICQELGRH